jgi:glycosyltransferase involved in cell wall biosynthesis
MPFAEVKALNERAAISIIPSKWREPFGRTCLEAHAGGAAVISSGSGGLKEISGNAALYALADDPENLFDALTILMNDEEKRYHLACEGNVRARRLFDLRRVASDLDDFCAQAMQEAGCE